MNRRALLAAAATLSAAIAVAIWLPVGVGTECPPPSFPQPCYRVLHSRLPLRFAIAIAGALPLAVMVGRRTARRWLALGGGILFPAGLAIALVRPCEVQLGKYCDRYEYLTSVRLTVAAACVALAAALIAATDLPGRMRWAAGALGVGGIAIAVLVPTRTFVICPSGGLGACFGYMDFRLPWRFAIGLAGLTPMAVVLAGRSLKRWLAVGATILFPTGLAMALFMSAGRDCGISLGIFCSSFNGDAVRPVIAAGSAVAACLLLAASRTRFWSAGVATLLCMGGAAAAALLPSTSGLHFNPNTIVEGTPDHRMPLRFLVAFGSLALAGLVLVLAHRLRQGRLPKMRA